MGNKGSRNRMNCARTARSTVLGTSGSRLPRASNREVVSILQTATSNLFSDLWNSQLWNHKIHRDFTSLVRTWNPNLLKHRNIWSSLLWTRDPSLSTDSSCVSRREESPSSGGLALAHVPEAIKSFSRAKGQSTRRVSADHNLQASIASQPMALDNPISFFCHHHDCAWLDTSRQCAPGFNTSQLLRVLSTVATHVQSHNACSGSFFDEQYRLFCLHVSLRPSCDKFNVHNSWKFSDFIIPCPSWSFLLVLFPSVGFFFHQSRHASLRDRPSSRFSMMPYQM